jgi:hypothetical protein
MNEILFLRSIFQKGMTSEESEHETTYHFRVKKREYTVTCSKDYPFEIPKISSHLKEEQIANVYDMAETLLGTPMIYDLILCCIKQDELDLSLSSSVVVDYELGNAPKITEDEFFIWIRNNQNKEVKNETVTGKMLFILNNHENSEQYDENE